MSTRGLHSRGRRAPAPAAPPVVAPKPGAPAAPPTAADAQKALAQFCASTTADLREIFGQPNATPMELATLLTASKERLTATLGNPAHGTSGIQTMSRGEVAELQLLRARAAARVQVGPSADALIAAVDIETARILAAEPGVDPVLARRRARQGLRS